MSLPTLYQLSQDLIDLMEMDDDATTEALTRITANQIEVKAESYCKFVKLLEATVDTFKAEEKRISDRRKAIEAKVERIRQHMKDCLLNAGIDKVDAGTFKVRMGLSQGSVVITNPAVIPARFLTIIPEQYIPDKTKIKSAIKAGEHVPGAHIEAGTTLTIR